jgi:hypothetical protein
MNTVLNFVLSTVAVLGFPAVVVWMFIQATDTPDVIFSYSSKECVRVDYPDGTHGDCSKLPKKFNFIWGE